MVCSLSGLTQVVTPILLIDATLWCAVLWSGFVAGTTSRLPRLPPPHLRRSSPPSTETTWPPGTVGVASVGLFLPQTLNLYSSSSDFWSVTPRAWHVRVSSRSVHAHRKVLNEQLGGILFPSRWIAQDAVRRPSRSPPNSRETACCHEG